MTHFYYRRRVDINIAESGKPVKYSTAEEILRAINNLLTEKGQPTVSLADLELKLE